MAKKPKRKPTRTKKLAPDKELARAATTNRTWSVSCDWLTPTATVRLTLRQWYAGQALVLLDHNMRHREMNMSYEQVAKTAFEIADALIAAERAKK